jgi:hypothetical protein
VAVLVPWFRVFPIPLQVKQFKIYGHLAADIYVILAVVSLSIGGKRSHLNVSWLEHLRI